MRIDDIEKIIYSLNRKMLEKKMKSKRFLDCANSLPKEFGGPSVYFHHKALIERKKRFLEIEHLEMIYALLPSWGMHRMGSDTKAKVCPFDEFQGSIYNTDKIIEKKTKSVIEVIRELKRTDDYLEKIEDIQNRNEATIKRIDEGVINKIAELIPNIQASDSATHLVSASKTLHHILPNIVPPIDREYSLRFMKGNKNVNTGEGKLAAIFIAGMIEFFKGNVWKDALKNKSITLIVPKLPIKDEIGAFNTSLPKIYDNLIVAFVKTT